VGLVYRFGAVEVRPDERQVLVEGTPAAVGARAFDLLLALIDQRDRVVPKDELLDKVWPGLVVEENNLQVQVSTLRKILGNHAIATLPGRGYRFVLPLEGEVSAPAAPAGPVTNLPAALNSFIGREREIAALKEALVNARLVTLTGTGGTGKTRLSLQVAAQVTGDYPDGVWLVELSPVADEQRVAQVVAFQLGVKEEPGRPITETLVAFARTRRMLLILDNCEHLVAGCAELARRLLLAAPSLKILASSREPLHVSGEARFPVPALDIPTEAVRLFVDRAVAIHRFFKPAEHEAAIAEICRRLEGIPLAIELAAARVGTMPIDRIASQLDECFRVLNRGDRAAPTRQQALRASIDWSYELLSAPERVLLRRLSVFAGGWTLEAAEAVAPGGEVGADVVDLLTQLAEKSLVETDERGERYRLLETVRQYAAELLAGSGESEELRTRHTLYYLLLAEKARANYGGAQAGLWFARLDAEIENFLAAHRWCDQAPDGASMGLRMSRSLRHYWIRGGHLGLGIQFARDALARIHPAQATAERYNAFFDVGQLCAFAGEFGPASRYMQECLEIARVLDDAKSIGMALQILGLARVGEGQIDAARAHLEEALSIAERMRDVNETASAANGLAQCERMLGNLDRAEDLYQKAMTMAAQAGNNNSVLITLLNLAMVAIERASSARARAMLVEAISMAEFGRSRAMMQSALECCSGLAVLLEDWERAAAFYGAAEAMAETTGLRRDAADEAFLAPRVKTARANLDAAAFEAAERSGRATSAITAIADARAWLRAIG
jgi:predicted ATPase/DNA-binding winged helix-turn-helix (wHTH) protein